MYSIKETKDIELNYRTSSVRKISNTEYQYHGKPNNPNLVLSNGIKRISYVAERIEIKHGNPSELIIHHSATSNFPKTALVIFPLVVSNRVDCEVDRLLGMDINETLDLDIGREITDFSMEIDETQKSAYIIRLSGGLPISNKPSIIEGACGLSGKEKIDLKTAVNHTKIMKSNPHKTSINSGQFNDMMKAWLQTGSKCYKNGIHFVKDGNKAVSMKNGRIIGAKRKDRWVKSVKELSDQQCSSIGGNIIGGSSLGKGGGISPNQEMECFPNEGEVFNKKFHIIYIDGANEEFVSTDQVSDTTLRNAMNAEVKRLKEHIEKLGGIYVRTAKQPNPKYIIPSGATPDGSINKITNTFFKTNKDIDIFITYYYSTTSKKLQVATDNAKHNITQSGALLKPNRVNECILVAIKQRPEPHFVMTAKKFSEEYLNKDFNRYTHISIRGYMTDTENQSMKVIMLLLVMMLSGSFSYYLIPGLYKIAVQRITQGSRECSTDAAKQNLENYYLVTAFNYFFVIFTFILPFSLMLFSGAVNGILTVLMTGGIICTFTLMARASFDRMYTRSFYPANGSSSCMTTTGIKNEASRFKALLYIPAALSTLIFT